MDPYFLKVLPGVLSAEQCTQLLKSSERQGYVPAVINTADGRAVLDQSHRDSDRVIIDDPTLAATLFMRLEPHLPRLYHGRALVGVNERMRYLKYSVGQRFRQHSDGSYTTADGAQTSLLTLMVYLSNVDRGGETLLYKDEDLDTPYLTVACKPGQVLLFDHDWYHEGAPVIEGVKYCFRTDVMFES